ncbi:hypothetical protein FRB94_006486 [Tulasnella sp. JGI-2019a]|nr:hypothetical protein FRB94_006486 [Tulasnella sp. JGI-2019a]
MAYYPPSSTSEQSRAKADENTQVETSTPIATTQPTQSSAMMPVQMDTDTHNGLAKRLRGGCGVRPTSHRI